MGPYEIAFGKVVIIAVFVAGTWLTAYRLRLRYRPRPTLGLEREVELFCEEAEMEHVPTLAIYSFSLPPGVLSRLRSTSTTCLPTATPLTSWRSRSAVRSFAGAICTVMRSSASLGSCPGDLDPPLPFR